MNYLKRIFSLFVATSMLFTFSMQSAQAALISSHQVAQQTLQQSSGPDRARIMAALSRADVRAELVRLGVAPAQVEERVAALTDEEASIMADKLDSAPAGGDGIIGAIVFVFLVLLVTDILGLTKIFPFTRSVR